MNRIVNAITPLGDALKFKSLQGDEGLSCLSEWTVRFVSEHAKLDLQSMLGQSVTFEIETGTSPRFLNGIVTGFELLHRETRTPRYYIYQATVRSWLWYATQNSDNRIFQNETAVDIITKVLGKYDFAVEIRLMNSYRKWGYCVQFQETDFSFVSRLMEHEGIYYWFRHEASRHVLVLTDEALSHDPLPAFPVIPFYPDDRLAVAMQACIADWQVSGELTPTGYATMDYDFQKPLADMSAKRRASLRATQGLDLEMYEPMGGYVDSCDSEHYVKVHLQSLQCLQDQAVARSNVRTMAPGYTFTLKSYPHQAENKAYLVVHTDYDILNPAYASHDHPDDEARFVVTSRHIPANVQYRASRSTPIPKMSGPQTATVVGPQGEEIWTDKYGRIKVQFHWDREGAMDENSSCWIRVSNPWAGGGFGGVQIPRVREEVVVDFINGNIDRPIAVGRVYNASNMPPVNLPDDATQSGFLTRSKNGTPLNANKLMFEDRQGSELLAMVAEKDMDTHVKNNQTHDVTGNVVSAITGLRSHTAHSTSDITMAAGAVKNYQADHNRTVQGSLDEQIGANLQQSFNDGVDETITGALTSTVGGQASHTLQGLHIITTTHDEETVNGTVSETVGTGETSNIKSNSQLQAGDITMASPTIYSESTQEEIDIKAGGPLDISSAGPGIVQTPGKIIKESPVNVETALMLDNNTVTRKKSYTLDLSVDGIKDVMVEGHNHNQNIADIKLYGMGDSMQVANIGLYGANIQLGGQDQKMGLLNVNITGIELDKGFKIKRPGGGGGVGTKGKDKDGSGGDGGKGGKGDKDGNGSRGDAQRPHSEAKEPRGRSQCSIGFDTGDEMFSLLDFKLPGAFPIEWHRTYRSNLWQKAKDSELGHRWITPFTVEILAGYDEYTYLANQGRPATCPVLEPGEVRYQGEDELIWLRPDEMTILINHKHRRVERFEKSGIRFRLVSISDRQGNRVELRYDENDRLSTISNNAHTLYFEYGESKKIDAVYTIFTNCDGNAERRYLARYQYDDSDDLIGSVDEYDSRRHYTYTSHLITRYSDRTGRGVNLEWDGDSAYARCIREYFDDGSHEIRLAWSINPSRCMVTDKLGHTTQYTFDGKSYINRIDHPDGTFEIRDRDRHQNIVKVTRSDGRIDLFSYDKFDNLVRRIRPDGSYMSWEYNDVNLPVKFTDTGGANWKWEYDEKQQLINDIDPLGRVTHYKYDIWGQVVSIFDAKGGTKSIQYNSSNQVIGYLDCSSQKTTWSYDEFGRVVKVTTAENDETSYTYDKNGNVGEIRLNGRVTYSIESDAEGRILHAAMNDNKFDYEYDSAGRLIARTDALGYRFGYGYDVKGRLNHLIDENGAQYRFEYDPFDRVVREVDFDGIETIYKFEKHSGQVSSVSMAGQTIFYKYDELDRLSERRSASSVERYQYDSLDRIIIAENSMSRSEYSFDQVGNLVFERCEYTLPGVIRRFDWHHDYDVLNNRIKTTRPDGRIVDWLMYGSGHVHGVMLDQQELISYERDRVHREKVRIIENSINYSTSYDHSGHIKEQVLAGYGSGKPTMFSRQYTYDASGQLVGIDDSKKGNHYFKFDVVGRVIQAATPEHVDLFRFDPANNLLEKRRDRRDRQSETLKISGIVGNILKQFDENRFEYDGRGNVIKKISPLKTQHFVWDDFGQLNEVVTSDYAGRVISRNKYFYDAFGRRIGKLANSGPSSQNPSLILYGWNQGALAFECQEGQSVHYLYQPGSYSPLLRYSVDDSVMPMSREAETDVQIEYYYCDNVGTPREITNSKGDLLWEGGYDLLKACVVSDTASEKGVKNNIRYQGQYLDDDTGLYYNYYRYYDPDTGRYLSKDPIGLYGNTNAYTYAANPLQWVDPFGLKIFNPIPYIFNGPGSGYIYQVFQRNDIDWDLPVTGKSGVVQTNLERALQDGKAPFVQDANGRYQQITLHHSRQDGRGPLFELRRDLHNGQYYSSKALHPHLPNGHPNHPVNRQNFNMDRNAYWQERARQEQQRRGNTGSCPL